MLAMVAKVVVAPLVVWLGSALGLVVSPFIGSLITGRILAITEWLTHPAILKSRRPA
ncbi:MAG: hypothetical protein ACM3ZA_02625 [Bacillota bacterium]